MKAIYDIYDSGMAFDGRYRLLRLLSGEGGSADVWLAIDLNTVEDGDEEGATKVVIKIYRPKNFIDIEGENMFRNEFKIVFGCHHENIIQPTYFSLFEGMPYLVLPYCPSGSSETLAGNLTKKEDIWKYIFEVASGLAYLHEHEPAIVHQDIKPANVLIDDSHRYAITDFGISAFGGRLDREETEGTCAYMAPERFDSDATPMPEGDIWAFGATVYELITGDAPFGEEGGSAQVKEKSIPPIRQDVGDEIKHLVYSCLSFDPAQRPSARKIVETVMKKRYAGSRRMVWISLIAVIILAIPIILFFASRPHSGNAFAHLNAMANRGDSVVAAQKESIILNGGVPTADNMEELNKAKLQYMNVVNDAPESYARKQQIAHRISILNDLEDLQEEYEYADRLAEAAIATDMPFDSIAKYSQIRNDLEDEIFKLLKQLNE